MEELVKKKLKDMTVKEISDICGKQKTCQECPLFKETFSCFGRELTYDEMNRELEFIRVRNYQYGIREYLVKFKKYYKFRYNYNEVKRYENCHVCVKELNSKTIQRVFNDSHVVVEEMAVKERATGRIIYKGNDYIEYLKTIGEYQHD